MPQDGGNELKTQTGTMHLTCTQSSTHVPQMSVQPFTLSKRTFFFYKKLHRQRERGVKLWALGPSTFFFFLEPSHPPFLAPIAHPQHHTPMMRSVRFQPLHLLWRREEWTSATGVLAASYRFLRFWGGSELGGGGDMSQTRRSTFSRVSVWYHFFVPDLNSGGQDRSYARCVVFFVVFFFVRTSCRSAHVTCHPSDDITGHASLLLPFSVFKLVSCLFGDSQVLISDIGIGVDIRLIPRYRYSQRRLLPVSAALLWPFYDQELEIRNERWKQRVKLLYWIIHVLF